MGNNPSNLPENLGGPEIAFPAVLNWETVTEGGVSPSLRQGAACADANNKIYIWGGVFGAGETVEQYDDLWVFDCEASLWQSFPTAGTKPSARGGASACIIGNSMYLFGGLSNNQGYLGDFYCLNLDTMSWSRPTASGMFPAARDKCSLCRMGKSNKLVLFGGFGPNIPGMIDDSDEEEEEEKGTLVLTWFNDIHVFDTESSYWEKITTTGEKPTPRAAHAAVMVQENLFVFGGRDAQSRQNDMFCLSLQSREWKKKTPLGSYPKGRSFHSMTAISENRLLVIGGMSREDHVLDDCHVYDLEKNAWVTISPTDRTLPSRSFHTCVFCNGNVVVFGGSTNAAPGPGATVDYRPGTWRCEVNPIMNQSIDIPDGYVLNVPMATQEPGPSGQR